VAAEYFISDTFVPPQPKKAKRAKVEEPEEEPLGAMAYAIKKAMEKQSGARR
jgi:hypothetical protein